MTFVLPLEQTFLTLQLGALTGIEFSQKGNKGTLFTHLPTQFCRSNYLLNWRGAWLFFSTSWTKCPKSMGNRIPIYYFLWLFCCIVHSKNMCSLSCCKIPCSVENKTWMAKYGTPPTRSRLVIKHLSATMLLSGRENQVHLSAILEWWDCICQEKDLYHTFPPPQYYSRFFCCIYIVALQMEWSHSP